MLVAPTHAFQQARDKEVKLAVRCAIDGKLGLPRKNTEKAMDTDVDGEVAPVRGVTKEVIEELLITYCASKGAIGANTPSKHIKCGGAPKDHMA
jgi:hypothetical protein